jgi:Ca2+/H+ antiporter, TMEM165/GDT1 family
MQFSLIKQNFNHHVSAGGGSDSSNISPDHHEPTQSVADVGFVHAFIASFSVIIVSELGDKTFFIAAIMAMRHPRLTGKYNFVTGITLVFYFGL